MLVSKGAYCSAVNCSNNKGKNPELSFFTFPKDPERSKRWVINCRREDLLEKSTVYLNKNCTICTIHFEDNQFMNTNKNSLIKTAVPTIFDLTNCLKQLTRKRKPLAKRNVLQSKRKPWLNRTLFTMNYSIECEQIQIKQEEDTLSIITEFKTEPRDIEYEIKGEKEEYVNFPEHFVIKQEIEPISHHVIDAKTVSEGIEYEIKGEIAEWENFPEHFDIKHEIESHHSNDAKTASEVNGTQESLNKLLQDKKSQDVQKNGEDNEIDMPFVDHSSETFDTELKERTEEKANTSLKLLSCNIRVHTNEKSFPCKFCGMLFSNKWALTAHIRTHTNKKPYSCDICKRSFSHKVRLAEHIRTHTVRPFSCRFCTKSFVNKLGLNRHAAKHINEKSFSCDVCKKSFSQKGILVEHVRIHLNDKPFSCGICNKLFNNKSHLNRHITTHICGKQFSCDFCGRLFTEKSGLNRHARIHTNDKPFSCNICNKSFTIKSYLSQHMRIHANDKPFSCNFCSKSFSHKCDLTRHMRTHKKAFSCNICRKSFGSTSHVTEHMITHSNLKPFSCNFCNNSYSQKSTLTRHTQTFHCTSFTD